MGQFLSHDISDNGCSILSALLDIIPFHVLVFGQDMRLRYANCGGRSLLAAGDGLGLRGPYLRLSDIQDASVLHRWLKRPNPLSASMGDGPCLPFSIHRPSGRQPLTAVVRWMPSRGEWAGAPERFAALFLTDPECPRMPSCRDLGLLFGLSHREAQISLALFDRRSLSQTAASLGIGINTAKTHLAHIFEKTGVCRQQDLIDLIHRSFMLVMMPPAGHPSERGDNRARGAVA